MHVPVDMYNNKNISDELSPFNNATKFKNTYILHRQFKFISCCNLHFIQRA